MASVAFVLRGRPRTRRAPARPSAGSRGIDGRPTQAIAVASPTPDRASADSSTRPPRRPPARPTSAPARAASRRSRRLPRLAARRARRRSPGQPCPARSACPPTSRRRSRRPARTRSRSSATSAAFIESAGSKPPDLRLRRPKDATLHRGPRRRLARGPLVPGPRVPSPTSDGWRLVTVHQGVVRLRRPADLLAASLKREYTECEALATARRPTAASQSSSPTWSIVSSDRWFLSPSRAGPPAHRRDAATGRPRTAWSGGARRGAP